MKENPKTYVLEDDEGKAHEYRINYYGVEEGTDLLLLCEELGGGALGRIAASFTRMGQLLVGDEAAIDGDMLSRGLVEFFGGIRKNGGSKLYRRILATAVRDNVPVPESYDAIYTGNLGELQQAVVLALKVNFGEPLGKLLRPVILRATEQAREFQRAFSDAFRLWLSEASIGASGSSGGSATEE